MLLTEKIIFLRALYFQTRQISLEIIYNKIGNSILIFRDYYARSVWILILSLFKDTYTKKYALWKV